MNYGSVSIKKGMSSCSVSIILYSFYFGLGLFSFLSIGLSNIVLFGFVLTAS